MNSSDNMPKLVQLLLLTVPSVFSVSFDRHVNSFLKNLSSTHFIDLKKNGQNLVFCSPFYNIITNELSILILFCWFKDLWTYSFIIKNINLTKTFHLIKSKTLLGELYATTASPIWIMHLLALFKIIL